jgi:hypothetical protein
MSFVHLVAAGIWKYSPDEIASILCLYVETLYFNADIESGAEI